MKDEDVFQDILDTPTGEWKKGWFSSGYRCGHVRLEIDLGRVFVWVNGGLLTSSKDPRLKEYVYRIGKDFS